MSPMPLSLDEVEDLIDSWELDPDVAILPINGRDAMREAQAIWGNLNHDEAAALAAAAGVPAVVPCHFDGVAGNLGDPAAFLAALDEEADRRFFHESDDEVHSREGYITPIERLLADGIADGSLREVEIEETKVCQEERRDQRTGVNARGGFRSLVSGGGVVVVHRRSGHRTLHCCLLLL